MRLNKISLAAMVLGGSALLAACGGGGDGDNLQPQSVAKSNTTAAINPSNGPAAVQSVLGKSFDFSAGVPNFNTTSPTTLVLSGTGAAPQFVISSADGNASGPMNYGSCIFTLEKSKLPGLTQGQTVPVSPCELSIATAGKPTDGRPFAADVQFVLGTTKSNSLTLPSVSINSSGLVSVNGSPVGIVTTVTPTGTTGGGN